MPAQQSSSSSSLATLSSSSSFVKAKKRKWTREQLLKSLEILGTLSAPLPPELPPSPPSSRSNSPAPHAPKRKLDSAQDPTQSKRPRVTSLPDKPPQFHHHHHYHHQPPQRIRSPNPVPNYNLRSEPSEDGELREETTATTTSSSRATVSVSTVLSTLVPIRRPRRGRPPNSVFDEIHDKYHQYGRMLKYSGDARFWSTYPATHKEYRPLANPPPPNSPYHKYGGLIARLELADALVCFTYSIWSRDYSRRSCFRETWATIEAFLGWCKHKWMAEDTIGDREKALLGLIWMIEGFIHGRKFQYAAKLTIDPEMDRVWSKMRAEMATLAKEVEISPSTVTPGQLPLGSQPTPPMLPSPASIAPSNSANSTPINNRASGTPSTASNTGNPSVPPRPVYTGPLALPAHLLPQLPNCADGSPPTPEMVAAAAKATTTFGPVFTFGLKEQSGGIVAAAYCMEQCQRVLNLPTMARHYPATFARMMGTSLAAHEEHEPDIEDEEGELFWPGQCITGEGIGWVCLMGKAMIKEFGRDIGYRGLEGVVPKPKPEEQGAEAEDKPAESAAGTPAITVPQVPGPIPAPALVQR